MDHPSAQSPQHNQPEPLSVNEAHTAQSASSPSTMTDPARNPVTDAAKQLSFVDPPADLGDPDLTENALVVLGRRYLRRDGESGEVIETPRQLFWRVATHVARGELAFADDDYGHALTVARDFYSLMATRLFMPNSPCLMNAGREMGMLSACFVLPVEDSIEGIFDSVKATAMIQKAGGGTGFSFSRLRPSGDIVQSSGGTTEGPLSFIQVFSKATEAIQQGAFRRGANMGMLRVDHPDVIGFIKVKDDRSQLTNYNISIAITDRFVEELRSAPDTHHQVQNPRSKEWKTLLHEDGEAWTVSQIWDLIIEHAHENGEPGVIFIDRINALNPIPNMGEIEATNPCGEQPLHAYDSCNLGSINLGLLVEGEGSEATFEWEVFKSIIHTTTRFLDDVIEVNKFPLPQIESMTRSTRRLGLGVMGFADALYKLGVSYNSEQGCAFGEEIMRVLKEESHLASEILAEERGVFPAWEGSKWEERGRRMRNSYTTTVAPTGTISILADCSGGIEPMFSLAFNRQVMKDTEGKPTVMREVNYVFEKAAKDAGYHSDELLDRIVEEGSLAHMDEVPESDREVFVTAHDIEPEWHMRMQAAFQKNCDASISKTINFAHDATVDDVRAIYERAIDLGVKGVTVYRDGCREMQPMALAKKSDESEPEQAPAVRKDGLRMTPENGDSVLSPRKLPEIMSCLRIRQMTPFGNMHVKVSVDPHSGREREVFAQLGKGGDVANSDLEAICRMLSLWLRADGSLNMAIKQFSGIGSSLSVPTKDGRIMSLADGLATALTRYLEAKNRNGLEALLLGRVSPDAEPAEAVAPAVAPAPKAASSVAPRNVRSYKLKCPTCSENLAFQEGCVKCISCGFSQC
ncbi:MAG: ribonucleoside-diphosphate reductase alpha chain [Planctomycetota bacterium]|jgi:ribonucleoside-diphosphate reductase alpha chain